MNTTRQSIHDAFDVHQNPGMFSSDMLNWIKQAEKEQQEMYLSHGIRFFCYECNAPATRATVGSCTPLCNKHSESYTTWHLDNKTGSTR